MKITNNFNAPDAIVEFYKRKHERYNKGDADYSVTGILKPVHQKRLQGQHFDEITEDVADSINLLFGEAVHYILEKYTKKGLTEERLYMTIDGMRISGKYDNFTLTDGILRDYKTAKTSQYGLTQSDHVAQLNIYATLLRANGYEVNKLEVVKIFKDWSVMMKSFKPNYPEAAWETTELEMWPNDKTLRFIKDRIQANQSEALECSAEERWQDPDKWAVMKDGGVKASRVFLSRDEADAMVKDKGEKYFVEFRRGMSKRCQFWCNVSEFCEQYKGELDE